MIKLKYKEITMERAILKEDLYEQVINKEILQQLNNLEQEKFIIDKDKIDKEEAKAILSQYISQVIRKSLNYIRDKEKEDSEKLIKQIEACNDIINILSKVSNEEDIKKYEIDKNGEILTSLYSKVNNKRALNSKSQQDQELHYPKVHYLQDQDKRLTY